MSTAALTPDSFMAQQQPPSGGLTPDSFMAQQAPRAAQSRPALPPGEIPLTSYGAATMQGLANIGKGAEDAVTGMYGAVRHPIDTAKGLWDAPGKLIDQIKQVPGAIRDINQSADPTGSYLKVAGETAGEGAGQAVVGAATPEVPGIVKDAAPPLIRGVARGTNAVLKRAPGMAGAAAGSAIGGWPGGAIGYALGKELLPKLKVPGEEFGLAKPVFSKVPLGPEAPPPEIAQSRGLGGYVPPDPQASGLGNIPVWRPPLVQQIRTLPQGQYEAPASPLPPQGQLGEGVYEGEYLDMEPPPAPPPTIRGALPRGQYAQPSSSLYNPRQLGPARLVDQIMERTTPSEPFPTTTGRRPAPFANNNTPAVQAGPPKFGDVETTVPQEDATPLLQKMLKGVKKAKAKKSTPMAAD